MASISLLYFWVQLCLIYWFRSSFILFIRFSLFILRPTLFSLHISQYTGMLLLFWLKHFSYLQGSVILHILLFILPFIACISLHIGKLTGKFKLLAFWSYFFAAFISLSYIPKLSSFPFIFILASHVFPFFVDTPTNLLT